jgi:hypothetical protein
VELTELETFTLEMLQEKDQEAQRQSHARLLRFMTTVSERTGIPVDAINVNPQTKEILDMRVQETAMDDSAPQELAVDIASDES